MANNIAFQPMGKCYQMAANTSSQVVEITADSPCNQYMFINHEVVTGGNPVYVRVATTSTTAAAPSNGSPSYNFPIPPGTVVVITGPQCGPNNSVFVSYIAETDSPECYVMPGEGLR